MTLIKPYGDQLDDGLMQVSFTLPVPASDEAREAAKLYVQQMGLTKLQIHMESIGQAHTFFVVYGQSKHTIDTDGIYIEKIEHPIMNFKSINEFIETTFGRKIIVVGACIGSDAHTVGIDAIFNMKGFAHDWGFERYPWMEAHNLRAQVAVEELAKKVVELKADAVLVSRIVTQRDEHITELKKFLEALKNMECPKHLIKICGGPRLTHQEAKSWGYDAGFGPGTKPSQVASFIVQELQRRLS